MTWSLTLKNTLKYTSGVEDDGKGQLIYVLFLGLSGCGKSSTINFLFNVSIAPVGDSESTTSEIDVYRVSHPDFGKKELRVIDTPGIEDTRGLENDARFLATLEEYLEKELGQGTPDVLIICSRFDDNRFNGEYSQFVKMLRSISALKEKISKENIVFLLTHFMHVNEKLQSDPSGRKEEFKKTISDYSLFSLPIHLVVAETQNDDEELEEVELGYKLPNGEIYPQNLCDEVSKIMQEPKLEFWSEICSRNTSKNIELFSKVPLLLKENARSSKMLEFLTVANFKTEETEISKILNETFSDLREKNTFPPDTLVYLQKALHFRFIVNLTDIPKTNVEISSLFREIGREKDAELILKEAFGLQVPKLPFDPLVGMGYDILQDNPLRTTPFEWKNEGQSKNYVSKLGYLAPSGIIATVDFSNKLYMEKFPTQVEYLNYRWNILGAEHDINIIDKFNGNLKPGSNIISRQSCPSVYVEFRNLNFEKRNPQFSPEFLSKLTNLGNLNMDTNLRNWEQFFQMYGTHVITHSHGGGSIEFFFNNHNCASELFSKVVQDLINGGENIPDALKNKIILKISGGNSRLDSQNPSVFFNEGENSLFSTWKKSLISFPSNLPNHLRVKSLAQILRESNLDSLADKMAEASNFFLKGEMPSSYKKMEQENSELKNRLDAASRKKANCISEGSSLRQTIAEIQIQTQNAERERLRISQEVEKTQNLRQETRNSLEQQKATSETLRNELKSCKDNSAGTESQLERERSNIRGIKNSIAIAQTSVSELQSRVLDLHGKINQCNSRYCNGEWQ